MSKQRATQSNPRKDSFFIGKRRDRPDGKAPHKFGESSSKRQDDQASSGSFFVTPVEKQQMLQEREAKSSARLQFKSKKNQVHPTSGSGEERIKKPFDKKKWRLQKYSKKYKLQQWEEKRKKGVLREYYKQIKDDEPKLDVQKIYEQYVDSDASSDNEREETENENNLNRNIVEERSKAVEVESKTEDDESSVLTSQTRKRKAFKKAHNEYERIQEEKKQKNEELQKRKLEKAEALKQYKEKKLEKYKKLNKKTKKGQPIMKYRMEMLLEQIQKSVQ